MIQFVIITPGRSGSTFLARSLSQHPEVICNEEIFNRSVVDSSSFNHFVQSTWYYRLTSFFFNRERLSTNTNNFPLSWLVQKFLRFRTQHVPEKVKAMGFKVSLDQLFAYPILISLLQNHTIIYLTRIDKLRMTLSLLAARKSGNYDRFSGKKIELAADEVKSTMQQLKTWENKVLAQLTPEYKLAFESLFGDSQTLIFQDISYLLKLSTAVHPAPSRQAYPDDISEWIKNFEEIESSIDDLKL